MNYVNSDAFATSNITRNIKVTLARNEEYGYYILVSFQKVHAIVACLLNLILYQCLFLVELPLIYFLISSFIVLSKVYWSQPRFSIAAENFFKHIIHLF